MTHLEPLYVVGAAIFDEQGRCLITQRSQTMSNALLWEFPGGKIERAESPQQALRREIQEELNLEIEVGDWLGQGQAKTTRRLIILDVYAASCLSPDKLSLREHAQSKWEHPQRFDQYAWAKADVPIVQALMTRP